MGDRALWNANLKRADAMIKLREKARLELAALPSPGESMLEVRPASRWIIRPSEQKPRPELYGPMWFEGDVSLLFGAKGVGKSLFAVQLAEDIATGSRSLTSLDSSLAPRRSSLRPNVLLIDFEHTTDQFTERYTYPSPVPGKLPCRTRFHFQRASFGEFGDIPKCFRGRIHDYLQYSIGAAIYESQARVVILDSINYLFRGPVTAASMTNVLKTLKLAAQMHKVSILATVQTPSPSSARSRSKRQPQTSNPQTSNSLSRYAHELQLASLADSAIILAPSTYGPQYRYTKLLSTRSQVPDDLAPTSGEVLTYQLNPGSPPYAVGGPTSNTGKFYLPERGVAAALGGRGGSLITYLGPSNEMDHLRDYAAEAEAAQFAQEKAIRRLARRSSKQAVVDGVLDGSFRRYLLGE